MILKKIAKNLLVFLIITLNFSWTFFNPSLPLYLGSIPIAKNISQKYQISICAIFKNEKKYLKEWIEYHRLIGIDHFYLYNNNSTDRPLEILMPYIKQGIVTLISWPDMLQDEMEEVSAMWALSTQVSAYENAIHTRAKNETEWLILMNVDEFLVPNQEISLNALLKKYSDRPGIVLYQACFDAAESSMVQGKLIIETEDLVTSEQPLCTEVEKMIFKPQLCQYFTWPPYKYVFKDDQSAIKVSKQDLRMNRYLHRFKTKLHFGKTKQKLSTDNRLIADENLQELLGNQYVVEDREKAILPYVAKLKQILQGSEGK